MKILPTDICKRVSGGHGIIGPEKPQQSATYHPPKKAS